MMHTDRQLSTSPFRPRRAARRAAYWCAAIATLPIMAWAQVSGPGSGGGMSFFITSAGSGNGANLGGLAGADRICQTLASSAGAGNKTWRAYLSTSASGGSPAVNARDRIGSGPWINAKGAVIAKSVDELHSPNNNLNKETALTEKGEKVKGNGDKPNMHDILTGSQSDGRAFPGDKDMTCGNWTKSGEGSAMLGHHDRKGLDNSAEATSWNNSHASKACSQEALISTGGNGLLYCFAAR